jgi:predicted ArsR family transcriptional regulator
MDRKEFLKTCAGGLCACTAACFAAPAQAVAAEAAKPEDWRLPFVKKRYAKLLDILSDKMSDEEMNSALHELGGYCSSLGDQTLEKYRGDVDGYSAYMRNTASGDIITYDREKGVITMTTDERADCFCPLNGVAAKTPGVVCNCSLGWQQHTWETLLQKKVRVELKEAVLRGGKRCTFEIHILEQAA